MRGKKTDGKVIAEIAELLKLHRPADIVTIMAGRWMTKGNWRRRNSSGSRCNSGLRVILSIWNQGSDTRVQICPPTFGASGRFDCPNPYLS
jgi:hypothetical protein